MGRAGINDARTAAQTASSGVVRCGAWWPTNRDTTRGPRQSNSTSQQGSGRERELREAQDGGWWKLAGAAHSENTHGRNQTTNRRRDTQQQNPVAQGETDQDDQTMEVVLQSQPLRRRMPPQGSKPFRQPGEILRLDHFVSNNLWPSFSKFRQTEPAILMSIWAAEQKLRGWWSHRVAHDRGRFACRLPF